VGCFGLTRPPAETKAPVVEAPPPPPPPEVMPDDVTETTITQKMQALDAELNAALHPGPTLPAQR
jgi:hypothetical protein